jgi:putative transposase
MRLLGQVIRRFEWSCLTYCLMDNHYHLLLLTPEPSLGAGMGRLNGLFAQRFNLRHDRAGRLWGDRFFSLPLRRDSHLLEAVRYIAWNPVRAGLCASPEDWPWSGHRALLGLEPPGLVSVRETLAYFGADGGDPRSRYRSYVAANLKGDCPSLGS